MRGSTPVTSYSTNTAILVYLSHLVQSSASKSIRGAAASDTINLVKMGGDGSVHVQRYLPLMDILSAHHARLGTPLHRAYAAEAKAAPHWDPSETRALVRMRMSTSPHLARS
jgi:hypothetical protein